MVETKVNKTKNTFLW